MSSDDALLDYYPTGEHEGANGRMVSGMLVAAQRDTVHRERPRRRVGRPASADGRPQRVRAAAGARPRRAGQRDRRVRRHRRAHHERRSSRPRGAAPRPDAAHGRPERHRRRRRSRWAWPPRRPRHIKRADRHRLRGRPAGVRPRREAIEHGRPRARRGGPQHVRLLRRQPPGRRDRRGRPHRRRLAPARSGPVPVEREPASGHRRRPARRPQGGQERAAVTRSRGSSPSLPSRSDSRTELPHELAKRSTRTTQEQDQVRLGLRHAADAAAGQPAASRGPQRTRPRRDQALARHRSRRRRRGVRRGLGPVAPVHRAGGRRPRRRAGRDVPARGRGRHSTPRCPWCSARSTVRRAPGSSAWPPRRAVALVRRRDRDGAA